MPQILNVDKLLQAFDADFMDIEERIQKKLNLPSGKKCTFDRTLTACVGPWTAPFGPCCVSVLSSPDNQVVCTPVLQFHALHQLQLWLKEAECELIRELRLQKPKRIGALYVACTVNPGRMCYELVLAVPFSKEE